MSAVFGITALSPRYIIEMSHTTRLIPIFVFNYMSRFDLNAVVPLCNYSTNEISYFLNTIFFYDIMVHCVIFKCFN